MDVLATAMAALASPGQHDRLLRLHTPLGRDVLVAETLHARESFDNGGFRLELTAQGSAAVFFGGDAFVAEALVVGEALNEVQDDGLITRARFPQMYRQCSGPSATDNCNGQLHSTTERTEFTELHRVMTHLLLVTEGSSSIARSPITLDALVTSGEPASNTKEKASNSHDDAPRDEALNVLCVLRGKMSLSVAVIR